MNTEICINKPISLRLLRVQPLVIKYMGSAMNAGNPLICLPPLNILLLICKINNQSSPFNADCTQ